MRLFDILIFKIWGLGRDSCQMWCHSFNFFFVKYRHILICSFNGFHILFLPDFFYITIELTHHMQKIKKQNNIFSGHTNKSYWTKILVPFVETTESRRRIGAYSSSGCGQKTNDKRGASFEFPVTGRQRLVVGSYGSASIVCDVIINELNLTCAFLSPLYSFELITPRVSFIISITTTLLVIYQVTRAHGRVHATSAAAFSDSSGVTIDLNDGNCILLFVNYEGKRS